MEYAEVLSGQDQSGYVQSTFSGSGGAVLGRIVSRVDSVVAQRGMFLFYWNCIMLIDIGVLLFEVYQCKIYWLDIDKKKERKHWLSVYGLNDFICSLIKCVVLTEFHLLIDVEVRCLLLAYCQLYCMGITKLNSVALVRTRTIPTERPPPVGEVSANFCG